MKQKIAFVVQDLVGQGVQHATAMMVRAFAADGWQVDLVVSQVHADYLKEGKRPFMVPDSVRLLYLPSRHSSRNVWALRRYLRNGGADVVVLESGLYTWCAAWATVGLRKRRLPRLIQVVHGNVYPPTGGWLRRLKLDLRFRFLYRKLHAVLFVSPDIECHFRMYSRSVGRRLRLATVGNAIVDEMYLANVACPPTHPWLQKKECPTFVIAGSYTPGKRHLDAMEAFRIASQQRRVRLIVYGRGYMESQFRQFVADHQLEDVISIAGYNDNLPAEINAADCLVSASDEESFGITLVEALACGTPVISTDCPYGPREILMDGKAGRLLSVGDVKALAQAVVDFVDGKVVRPTLESWQRYTVESVLAKYKEAMGI